VTNTECLASEQIRVDLRALAPRLVAELRRVERMQRDAGDAWPAELAGAAERFQKSALALIVEARRAAK